MLLMLLATAIAVVLTATASSCEGKSDEKIPRKKKGGTGTIPMSLDLRPHKQYGRKTIFLIGVQTLCPCVLIYWLQIPHSGRAAFIYPLLEAFNSNPEYFGQLWHICAWLYRRGQNGEILMEGPNSTFAWRAATVLALNDISVEEEGIHMACALNESSTSGEVTWRRSGTPTVEFHKDATASPPLPVGYYLTDTDTLVVLRKVYSDTNVTLSMLREDEEILEMFFGSIEAGQAKKTPIPNLLCISFQIAEDSMEDTMITMTARKRKLSSSVLDEEDNSERKRKRFSLNSEGKQEGLSSDVPKKIASKKKQYREQYKRKNAAKIKEGDKQYKRKNAARIKDGDKQYREKNAAKIKEEISNTRQRMQPG
eukprot:scaffold24938_cov115-Skeletonema_dohrnii-CCMP3373.AAC.1